jgi:hypothetical protein
MATLEVFLVYIYQHMKNTPNLSTENFSASSETILTNYIKLCFILIYIIIEHATFGTINKDDYFHLSFYGVLFLKKTNLK